MTKSALRKTYRDIRQQISLAHAQVAAMAAADHLIRHAYFTCSAHISCYLPFQSEMDTKPLIEAIWRAQKICYLPVLMEARTLRFARYDAGDKLELNQVGIMEPVNPLQFIAPENLELVVMPLIAFDVRGNRLGTGGGYYDRTFAFLHESLDRTPKMLGFGYTVQQIETVPSDPWDIRLDSVITENGFLSTLK